MIVLKSGREIALMREAGRVVAQAHQLVRDAVRPGISTQQLDELVAAFIAKRGGRSSFLGYYGFPAHTCISVNEELVHGIPGPRVLAEGDIVSVDIGVILDGYHGDSAWSYAVGQIDPDKQRLFDVTERALWLGIEQACNGNRLADVSEAVQQVVEAAGFFVVREYVGHGIGRQMHEDPQIPNYWDARSNNRGPRLRNGMTFALEPMVQAGTAQTRVLDDQWTVVSADGSPAAHFEHTIAITPDGPQILTLP